MKNIEHLIRDLPDPEAARRFLSQLAEQHPSQLAKLLRDYGLLSDVLAIVSFSPLLAATLLQDPDYFWWLNRKRRESGVRSKDEILESLARFAMTNSQVEPHVLFARFRRRELLRIYLRDIRRLATIAEITEEISNLADAILESALVLARNEMDGRFGQPQEEDEKGRRRTARFCIAALGKLGSRELNYSSDIDLFFLYSGEGETTGSGSRGNISNREYFIKLAEFTTRLVGERSGEGGAYRVDLRLRPHGTLGSLAKSVADTVRYYKTEARPWERQVMIRSRGCAGAIRLFREFFSQIEDLVFSTSESVDSALRNVRQSKEKIDLGYISKRGFDVKLGRGGIREIEFLAQALQLAYGGRDPWLRSPHTLICLARLADRGLLSESELTGLASAYDFLRRTEHVLQMENGLQTHYVPSDPASRSLLARRTMFAGGGDFEKEMTLCTANVSRIFTRVFGEQATAGNMVTGRGETDVGERTKSYVMASIAKSDVEYKRGRSTDAVVDKLSAISPHFAAMVATNPHLIASLPDPETEFPEHDYLGEMMEGIVNFQEFGQRLAAMRRTWSRLLLEIVVRDAFELIDIQEAKRLQTSLAEGSIEAAIQVVSYELAARHKEPCDCLGLAVLALGKLGGRGLDYDSDLDLVLVFDDDAPIPAGVTYSEYYGLAAELLVNVISSMTRDGSLYRVDLRLRPYGSKGLSAISCKAFAAYFRDTAEIWEMLAFVKLRAVGGVLALGLAVEDQTRSIIHQRAEAIPREKLQLESTKVRDALEKQRSRTRGGSDIDIKYGAGGMLDIYFAARYLQLRDNVPDDTDDRSTMFILNRLQSIGSLTNEDYSALATGYEFLSALDHNLRLTIGRTTRVRAGNRVAMSPIARRMGLKSVDDLFQNLALHRLSIRSAYEHILLGP
ncbi:hypothetical protein BH20ACI2_BH20ACI2_22090 [soil metagenome]